MHQKLLYDVGLEPFVLLALYPHNTHKCPFHLTIVAQTSCSWPAITLMASNYIDGNAESQPHFFLILEERPLTFDGIHKCLQFMLFNILVQGKQGKISYQSGDLFLHSFKAKRYWLDDMDWQK